MEDGEGYSPDGFNMAFFQSCWSFLKDDLVKAFEEFLFNGRVTTGMNSTFITLVPRKDRYIKVPCF